MRKIEECRCAAFSPDRKTLATAGWDGGVKIWDTRLLAPAAGNRAARR